MWMSLRSRASAACLAAGGRAAARCGEAKVGGAQANAKQAAQERGAVASAGAVVGAGGGPQGTAKEVADPQEANSFPATGGALHHPAAATPAKASEAIVAAGAPSDAEVRSELAQMQAAERSAKQAQKASADPGPGGAVDRRQRHAADPH